MFDLSQVFHKTGCTPSKLTSFIICHAAVFVWMTLHVRTKQTRMALSRAYTSAKAQQSPLTQTANKTYLNLLDLDFCMKLNPFIDASHLNTGDCSGMKLPGSTSEFKGLYSGQRPIPHPSFIEICPVVFFLCIPADKPTSCQRWKHNLPGRADKILVRFLSFHKETHFLALIRGGANCAETRQSRSM